MRNAEENYRGLIASTRRARRLADSGRLPEIQVDQVRARRAGVSSRDIAHWLQSYMDGREITQYREGDIAIPVLAIAVIAGMAVTFRESTDLDFLVLDDPSQGMDAAVAGRLGG